MNRAAAFADDSESGMGYAAEAGSTTRSASPPRGNGGPPSTRVPTATSAPSPTPITSPAISSPGVNGSGGLPHPRLTVVGQGRGPVHHLPDRLDRPASAGGAAVPPDAAGARRRGRGGQRGDPARPGDGCPGVGHRRRPREGGDLPSARRRGRDRLPGRGLHRRGQGRNQRPRSGRDLRLGRRRHLRPVPQVHRLRGANRRRRVCRRPNRRRADQPPAAEELRGGRFALGALPAVRARPVRADPRRVDGPARSRRDRPAGVRRAAIGRSARCAAPAGRARHLGQGGAASVACRRFAAVRQRGLPSLETERRSSQLWGRGAVDFRDTPEEASFRADLRRWLAANLPADWASRDPKVGKYTAEESRPWSRQLFDAGYVGLTWPKEYGGQGAPYTYQGIYLEETARAGAPPHIGGIGLGMAGPTIISHGTEEQKTRYLQPLLSAEEIWCQGFSEPGAGSDLAGARTRAVRDGDDYVVNGQKVW